MSRPCECEKCNRCLLYQTSDFHNRLWGGPGVEGKANPVAAVKSVLMSCPNRGEPTGELAQCKTCSGNVQLKIFACSAHPEGCTVGKAVAGYHLCDGGSPAV